MRFLKTFLFILFAFVCFAAPAQNNATYKITSNGVIKTVETSDGAQHYNIAKPIVVLKTRYELGTEDAYSRFSIESARLGVQGDLSKVFSYRFLVDFCAESKLNVLDLYAVIKPLKKLSFTVGQHGLPLFNPWTVSPNSVDYINRPFLGKYFTSSRDIGVTMKYALKSTGFPINAELGVYNGSGINNPTWNKSLALGGKLEFGSTKEGFRTSARFYNVKNSEGKADLYLGGDIRYASDDFKIEAEYMTKQYGTASSQSISPDAHSAAHIQGMYKIKVNSSLFNRIEPLLRWDAMGYNVADRGFGVNRVTAGANFVLKTAAFTSMFRLNYEHFLNSNMDLSALIKNAIDCQNRLSVEYLLYF